MLCLNLKIQPGNPKNCDKLFGTWTKLDFNCSISRSQFVRISIYQSKDLQQNLTFFSSQYSTSSKRLRRKNYWPLKNVPKPKSLSKKNTRKFHGKNMMRFFGNPSGPWWSSHFHRCPKLRRSSSPAAGRTADLDDCRGRLWPRSTPRCCCFSGT